MTELSYSFNERRLCGKSSPRVLCCLLSGLWEAGLRVRTGLQCASLQEEVSGICQVRGAAVPSGRECVLLAHSSTAALERGLGQRWVALEVITDIAHTLNYANSFGWNANPLCLCVAAVLFERAQVKSFFCRIRSVCFILSELHLVQHYYSFSSDMLINRSHLFK